MKSNLDALSEIRDNAVHFMNVSPELRKIVLEVGTASVKNYIELARRWLGHDLSRYNLYLMPIGFFAPRTVGGVQSSGEEAHLVSYLSGLASQHDDGAGNDFHVVLEVEISMRRSPGAPALVSITNDPAAPVVRISEADIRQQFPWDFAELVRRLRARYVDFTQNPKFLSIRAPLMDDGRLVQARYLEPGNPRSLRKNYYSPNIISAFDAHYVRR